MSQHSLRHRVGIERHVPSHVVSEEGGGKDGQHIRLDRANNTYPKYDTDRWGQMIGNQIDDIVIGDLDINTDGISSTDDVMIHDDTSDTI